MQIATPDFVMIQKFQGSDCLHYICTGEKCNAYDTPAVRAIKSHIIYFSQKTKEHAISSEKEFFFLRRGLGLSQAPLSVIRVVLPHPTRRPTNCHQAFGIHPFFPQNSKQINATAFRAVINITTTVVMLLLSECQYFETFNVYSQVV